MGGTAQNSITLAEVLIISFPSLVGRREDFDHGDELAVFNVTDLDRNMRYGRAYEGCHPEGGSNRPGCSSATSGRC